MKCYKHFSTPKTWTEARSLCQENAPQDGDLASIPSQAIHNFLTTLTSEKSWVGGYLHPNNGWSWSDNTQWSFESWKPGYPNNYGGNEDSVEINFGQDGDWNDASGAVQRTYICQYKTLTTTSTTTSTTTTTTSTTTTTTTTSGTTENKAILMVGGKHNKMEIFDTETGDFCTAILELPHRRYGHTIGAYTIQMIINLKLECLFSCRCCCWQESCLWRRLHRSWENLHLAQW